jgi:hypothetical protein
MIRSVDDLTADNIIATAEELGVRLRRGLTIDHAHGTACALGVIGMALADDPQALDGWDARLLIAKHGLDREANDIEYGFEGYEYPVLGTAHFHAVGRQIAARVEGRRSGRGYDD